MDQISAAENLVIEMLPNRWRLLSGNGETGQQLLAEAIPGALSYTSSFGTTRRLPTSGSLASHYMDRVVLGWSYEDESWHLGLLLGQELTSMRGSRWCELVSWPDPDTTVFADLARESAETLAKTLSLPFYLVPPETAPTPEPAPLPAPPFQFGIWVMERIPDSNNLVITRDPGWVAARYTRAAWYLLWMVIYLVISLATLFSDLALPNAGTLLPNPQLLPYMGLATAVLLLGLVIYQFYLARTQPDTVVIDTEAKRISAWRGDRLRWEFISHDIQSVYVTEVIKKKDEHVTSYHGELNLHLGGGEFFFVLQQHQQEDNLNARRPEFERPQDDEVLPLTTDLVNTDLQAAGLTIASVLGNLPCWHDVRVK